MTKTGRTQKNKSHDDDIESDSSMILDDFGNVFIHDEDSCNDGDIFISDYKGNMIRRFQIPKLT